MFTVENGALALAGVFVDPVERMSDTRTVHAG
jgi:hypothetical protein